MLRDWQLHKDYQDHLRQKLTARLEIERSRVESLDKAINKLWLVPKNLAKLVNIIILYLENNWQYDTYKSP